jgi:hypothetical protein
MLLKILLIFIKTEQNHVSKALLNLMDRISILIIKLLCSHNIILDHHVIFSIINFLSY